MGYREYQPSVAPPWLRGTNGTDWLESSGQLKDDELARLKEAVKARMPGSGTADALPYIGEERGGLERKIGESDADYRVRLADAWSVWPYAGTAYGLLLALDAIGYTSTNGNPAIVTESGLGFTMYGAFAVEQLSPDLRRGTVPYWWTTSETTFHSRFAVLFRAIELPSTWTDIQASPSASTHPTDTEVDQIKRVIRRWKRATQTCLGIYVGKTGNMWGWPTSLQYGPGDDWGGSVVHWSV